MVMLNSGCVAFCTRPAAPSVSQERVQQGNARRETRTYDFVGREPDDLRRPLLFRPAEARRKHGPAELVFGRTGTCTTNAREHRTRRKRRIGPGLGLGLSGDRPSALALVHASWSSALRAAEGKTRCCAAESPARQYSVWYASEFLERESAAGQRSCFVDVSRSPSRHTYFGGLSRSPPAGCWPASRTYSCSALRLNMESAARDERQLQTTPGTKHAPSTSSHASSPASWCGDCGCGCSASPAGCPYPDTPSASSSANAPPTHHE